MCVKDVSGFIDVVTQIYSQKSEDTIVVYRGEGKFYPTFCQPNIFRDSYLFKNKFFEKNLFDEMVANKITDGGTYLEKAIDAQHDGFPSRFLDVTYNSLVALYFATTPYFHKVETCYDDVDGIVYVFFIEKLFCPSGDNINSAYNAIIGHEGNDFINEPIFQKNHKLIDHISTNKRIVAQQGAFILFQGNEICPIPEFNYKKITIAARSKSKIREDLKSLFGIHTGSIYPEATNLVNHIINRSSKINNISFGYEDELKLVVTNLQNELEHYKKCLIDMVYNNYTTKELLNKVMDIEEKVCTYKLGLKDCIKDMTVKEISRKEYDEIKDNISLIHSKIIDNYNRTIDEFYNAIRGCLKCQGIEMSYEELIIDDGGTLNE